MMKHLLGTRHCAKNWEHKDEHRVDSVLKEEVPSMWAAGVQTEDRAKPWKKL